MVPSKSSFSRTSYRKHRTSSIRLRGKGVKNANDLLLPETEHPKINQEKDTSLQGILANKCVCFGHPHK